MLNFSDLGNCFSFFFYFSIGWAESFIEIYIPLFKENLFLFIFYRFWAVTNVDYMHSRTSKRVFSMIFLVWFASVIVSLAPQFGWKDPEYLQRIEQLKCMVSQDVGYQVSFFYDFIFFSYFFFF